MALSNIRREPRREITEQVVGIVVFVGYMAMVYGIVDALHPKDTGDWIFFTFIISVLLPAIFGLLFMLIHLIHGVGDIVCNLLGNIGLDPRPKQRY